MNSSLNKVKYNSETLYNNLLLLSRNKLFYTNYKLEDSFQNRIILIFLHVSFIFIKAKEKNGKIVYNKYYQSSFDFIFNKIEENMREIGWGDVTVNKAMKKLVKVFYDILLNCEKYAHKAKETKYTFLNKYLIANNHQKHTHKVGLVEYFDKYMSFCIDLSSDNVLKGDINFKYK